ncbi:MAG TPA: hypothetical protein V6D12_13755 [Candidatus Obscuribacterales bacterium]
MSLEVVTGTVKYTAGRIFETQHGQRINVVATLISGEEVKLWGNPGEAALTTLKKGQSVNLLKDGNKGYKLLPISVELDPPAPTPAPTTTTTPSSQGWTPEERKAIAAQATDHAKLMRFCYDQIIANFGNEPLSEESRQKLAITIYLKVIGR